MPAAARKWDTCVPHCSPSSMEEGSTTVMINGLGACRKWDKNNRHQKTGSPCSEHQGAVASGSTTVTINGLPAARVGDPLIDCTSISQGSPTVFIGG